MSNQIHPTAVVAKGASLGSNIQIGPYSVIDEHVSIADGCIIGPHVHITGHTTRLPRTHLSPLRCIVHGISGHALL